MRFKWLSGERCEFSFTPQVLTMLRVVGQRTKKVAAEFTLAVNRGGSSPSSLIDID